jgi:hypothetical protein
MNSEKREEILAEESLRSKSSKKKFHGFSMGFLLLLLGLVVAIYVVCTILAT